MYKYEKFIILYNVYFMKYYEKRENKLFMLMIVLDIEKLFVKDGIFYVNFIF